MLSRPDPVNTGHLLRNAAKLADSAAPLRDAGAQTASQAAGSGVTEHAAGVPRRGPSRVDAGSRRGSL